MWIDGFGDRAGVRPRRVSQTVVREVSGEIVEKGLKNIDKNLARLVEKATIDGEQERRNSRAA